MSQTNISQPSPDVSRSRSRLKSRKGMVQPWYVSSKTFMVLWLILLLLMCGGFATLLARVPVYASGIAIVVDGKSLPQYGQKEPLLAIFLPPETLNRLHAGQSVVFQTERNSPRQTRTVLYVLSEPLSPDAAQQRFNLSAGAGVALPPLSAVVLARFNDPTAGAQEKDENLLGRSVRADVEVGTRRAGSFMPVVSHLFEDQ